MLYEQEMVPLPPEIDVPVLAICERTEWGQRGGGEAAFRHYYSTSNSGYHHRGPVAA